MEFNILYINKNQDDINKTHEIAINYGFSGYTLIPEDIKKGKYVIFCIFNDNGMTNKFYYYSDSYYKGKDDFIKQNLNYNHGEYFFIEDINKLESVLRYKTNKNIKYVLENPKDRLVYESSRNDYSIDTFYRAKTNEEINNVFDFLEEIGFVYSTDNEKSVLSNKDTGLILAEYYPNLKPNWASSNKMIYSYYSDRGDDYYINNSVEYNNGNYYFAKNVEDFKNVILKLVGNGISLYTLNMKKNIYEDNVIKFSDFENIEYRRGSKELGGLVTKLLEFLRLYDTVDDLVFSIDNFVKSSNITINEINKLIESRKNGQKLFDFDIKIENNKIHFVNLNKTGKNRPFESNSF